MDQPIPGYSVSVWADPDIGEALFYIVLEPGQTNAGQAISSLELWVEPVTGRLPKAVYQTTPEPARGHLKFVAKPEFDAAERWTVGIDIRLADGSSHSLLAQVESTPPGLGRWGLVVYLFPFVLFGGLWATAFVRRSRSRAARPAAASAKTEFTPERSGRTLFDDAQR